MTQRATFRALIELCSAAALLSGCVLSVYPVVSESDATFDARLLGSWEEVSGSDRAVVTRGPDNTYAIEYAAGGKVTKLLARLGRLGERAVLDVWPAEPDSASQDLSAAFAIPGHLLVALNVRSEEVRISLLDPDSLRVAGMYFPGPALSEGGECGDLVVFDSNRSGAADLYAVPTGGGEPRLLTARKDSGDYSRVADWSPDRTRLVFQGKRGTDEGLFLIACAGGVATPLPNSSDGGAPAWSPDGRRIAFVRQAQIFMLDLHGGAVARPAVIPDSSFYPAWSPDGTHIAFVGRGPLTWEIFALNIRAGAVRQLTHAADAGSPSQGPAWSPDGRRIAFDRKHGEDFDLYVMNADGTSPVRLTHAGGVNARPAWSPDGKSIAFHSTRDRPRNASRGDRRYFEIYTMSADGTRVKRLTNDENFDGHPAW